LFHTACCAMDFVQRLDPSKLVMAGTLLSFGLGLFTAPPYNFPLFLFATYLQENAEATRSQLTFTCLLGVSALFDIVWMARHDQHGFITFLTVLLMLLKIPTFFVFASTLRDRQGHFGGFSRFDSVGATVWSMPGGFTSSEREGYQPVDEERPQSANNVKPSPSQATHAQQTTPGAYQV